MFDLERAIHRNNAARGLWHVRQSAKAIRQAPHLWPVLMPKHRELQGRTLASFQAMKETM